jgi:integrase
MIKLVRVHSGAWQGVKTIPADCRAAYRAAFGQGFEVRKRWSSKLTPGEARAEFAAWLSQIENRIVAIREGRTLASPPPGANRTGAGRVASVRRSPIQLFDVWANDRRPAESTVARWRACLVVLTERFPDASAIDATAARDWLRSLITPERTAATVRNIWRRSCNVIFGHAVNEGLIAANPFAAVRIPVPRARPILRDKAFTHEELRMILLAALVIDPNKGPLYAARRWCPWLAAYSGARMGELTQLRGCDVQLSYDTGACPAMVLTPEAGTVKTRAARIVPLHQHVIDQGFYQWAQARGDGPLFYVPDTKKRSRPQSIITLKELQRWLRKTLGLRGVSTHGFRHTFRRTASRCMEERLVDALLGHSPASIGRGYGVPSIEDKVVAMWQFPTIEI